MKLANLAKFAIHTIFSTSCTNDPLSGEFIQYNDSTICLGTQQTRDLTECFVTDFSDKIRAQLTDCRLYPEPTSLATIYNQLL